MTFLQLLSDMEEKMIWMLKFMGGLCLEIDEAERKASYIKGIENERKVVVETLEANHGEYTRMNAVVVLTIPLKSLLAATVTKIWICILCKTFHIFVDKFKQNMIAECYFHGSLRLLFPYNWLSACNYGSSRKITPLDLVPSPKAFLSFFFGMKKKRQHQENYIFI
eukprot:m.194701 g.194701  ORF g.194701 m.194701 type:complete len:166 (+) comp15678_c0_seq12:1141-1638(+)